MVRIRPPVRDDEKFGEGSEALQVDKERNVLWLLSKDDEHGKGHSTKQYVFDRVLWKDSKQAARFPDSAPSRACASFESTLHLVDLAMSHFRRLTLGRRLGST